MFKGLVVQQFKVQVCFKGLVVQLYKGKVLVMCLELIKGLKLCNMLIYTRAS